MAVFDPIGTEQKVAREGLIPGRILSSERGVSGLRPFFRFHFVIWTRFTSSSRTLVRRIIFPCTAFYSVSLGPSSKISETYYSLIGCRRTRAILSSQTIILLYDSAALCFRVSSSLMLLSSQPTSPRTHLHEIMSYPPRRKVHMRNFPQISF